MLACKSLLQNENAPFSISLTVEGIVIEDILLSSKAETPTISISDGIFTSSTFSTT